MILAACLLILGVALGAGIVLLYVAKRDVPQEPSFQQELAEQLALHEMVDVPIVGPDDTDPMDVGYYPIGVDGNI